MKKIKLIVIGLFATIFSVQANPVNVSVAEKAAESFYASFHPAASDFTLAYTERDASGIPVYYVFDVNGGGVKGFVIVTADDAAHPIIGYSDEGNFVIPDATNNVGFWLGKSKEQVTAMRAQNITATSTIADEWAAYTSSTKAAIKHTPDTGKNVNVQLCQTIWNQSPLYNAYCPGGSVTGCVATAMAQIMRYWKYPSVGTGSTCYDDVQPYFSENYGQLCAEFDTSHYVWSEMPYNIGVVNPQIAKLMYDCGVSVDMDYSPTGSGSQVMGGSPSAYNSYTQYFGYDPNTISTASYDNSQQADFTALLVNEFRNGRPVQYQGFDVNNGGHSWVCDGYSSINTMHMNWGWGQQDDGWYAVNTLNPSPFDFTYGIAVIYGIQPPPGAFTAVAKVTADNTTISVYPNPSRGVFSFTLSGNTSYQVNIYNVLGQEINNSVISSANNQINLSAQPAGVYIYKLLTDNGTPVSTGRLVVSK